MSAPPDVPSSDESDCSSNDENHEEEEDEEVNESQGQGAADHDDGDSSSCDSSDVSDSSELSESSGDDILEGVPEEDEDPKNGSSDASSSDKAKVVETPVVETKVGSEPAVVVPPAAAAAATPASSSDPSSAGKDPITEKKRRDKSSSGSKDKKSSREKGIGRTASTGDAEPSSRRKTERTSSGREITRRHTHRDRSDGSATSSPHTHRRSSDKRKSDKKSKRASVDESKRASADKSAKKQKKPKKEKRSSVGSSSKNRALSISRSSVEISFSDDGASNSQNAEPEPAPRVMPKFSEDEAASVIARSLRRWAGVKADRQAFIPVFRAHKKRTMAAWELLTTEESYVDGINTVVKCYLTKFREAPDDVVSPAEIKTIFSDIEILQGLNNKLCADLKNIVGKDAWTPHSQLGPLFKSFSQFFMLYSTYCNNYSAAAELVKTLSNDAKRKTKFLALLREGRTASKSLLDLESYLIMPVQRIPRYKMLLTEILKNTPESHADYIDLKGALETLSTVATALNSKMKSLATITRLAQIESQIQGLPEGRTVQDSGRSLLGEFDVRIHDEASLGQKKPKKVTYIAHYAFVFNDMILWTAPLSSNSDRYSFVRQDYRADLAATDRGKIPIKVSGAMAAMDMYKLQKVKSGSVIQVPAVSVMSLKHSALTLSFDTQEQCDRFRELLNASADQSSVLVGGQKISTSVLRRQRSWDDLESSVQVQKTSQLVKRVQEEVASSKADSTHKRKSSVSAPLNDDSASAERPARERKATVRKAFFTLRTGSKKGDSPASSVEAKPDFRTKNPASWWTEWDTLRLDAQLRCWKEAHPNRPLPSRPLDFPDRRRSVSSVGDASAESSDLSEDTFGKSDAAPSRPERPKSGNLEPKSGSGPEKTPSEGVLRPTRAATVVERGSGAAAPKRVPAPPPKRDLPAPPSRTLPPPPKRDLPAAPKRALGPTPKQVPPPPPKRDVESASPAPTAAGDQAPVPNRAAGQPPVPKRSTGTEGPPPVPKRSTGTDAPPAVPKRSVVAEDAPTPSRPPPIARRASTTGQTAVPGPPPPRRASQGPIVRGAPPPVPKRTT